MGDLARAVANIDFDDLGIPELDAIPTPKLVEGVEPEVEEDEQTVDDVERLPEESYLTEPPALVQSLAKKAGISVAKAEERWEEAKASAKKAHPDIDEDSDRFYALVVGYFKKMLGLTDSITGGPEQLLVETRQLNERVKHLCTLLERALEAGV